MSICVNLHFQSDNYAKGLILMNKKVLVTGATRGIGKAIGEEFIKHGCSVFGTYYKSFDLTEKAKQKYGEQIHWFGPYDFTDTMSSISFLSAIKGERFDTVVLNAGIFSSNNDFDNFDLDLFRKVMNCNFYTPLILALGLKEQISDGGSIVIISSNDAYSGAYSSISYSVSKAALISLTRCLCVNYGKRGIRVNAVAPGAIDTDMNTDEQREIAPYFTPISRVGKSEDVGKLVYFLSTDESAFISGQDIAIDGGFGNINILLKSEHDEALSRNLLGFVHSFQ